MRRIVMFLTTASLAVAVSGMLAGVGGAQTGDLAAFCAARLEANSAETKAETKAVIAKVYSAAPAAAVPAVTAIRDGFDKKGDRYFESPAGRVALTTLDAFVYDNCPGTKVPVTAIDYEFQGVPATLKAGPTNFKMTNAAPKEGHMMGIFKMTPVAQGKDLEKILSLPQKKSGKYLEPAAFMEAGAGEVAYTPVNLEPGTYAYVCFFPVGGKNNGAPHFVEGMYGTFTVS